MAHTYAPPALRESSGERWRRQAKSSILTACLITLLFWAALRPLPEPRSVARASSPILVTLLPTPPAKPANTLPVQPVPLKPEPKQKSEVGGQRHRQAPVPHYKPALAVVAPPHVDLAERMRLPMVSALPSTDPVTPSTLEGANSHAGSQELGVGHGNVEGTGTGNAGGNDSGDIDVLYKADWVTKPTDEALKSFIPTLAALQHVSGKAVIACRVKLSTLVHGCRILAESKLGFGFGNAAIAASRIFRVHPPRRNGKPIDEAWVAIPVLWISTEAR